MVIVENKSETMKQEIKITLGEYLMLTTESKRNEYNINRLLEVLFGCFEKNYRGELDIDLGYKNKLIFELLEKIDKLTFTNKKNEILSPKDDKED